LSAENAYWEYLGMEFEHGRMDAAWADNSNILLDNADSPPAMDPFHAVLPEPGVGIQMLVGVGALLGLAALRRRG
jgi:hypothetical protein